MARTMGFPGVSEGFRGFPRYDMPWALCKTNNKTYRNQHAGPSSERGSSGRADPLYITKEETEARGADGAGAELLADGAGAELFEF